MTGFIKNIKSLGLIVGLVGVMAIFAGQAMAAEPTQGQTDVTKAGETYKGSDAAASDADKNSDAAIERADKAKNQKSDIAAMTAATALVATALAEQNKISAQELKIQADTIAATIR